jgi:hypothetical protein
MIRRLCLVSAVALLSVVTYSANAQAAPTFSERDTEDNPIGNVHLGTPIVIPVGDTAKAVHLGFGLNVGGGYNFTREHGLVGEFLWNNLLPTNEAQAKVRTALNDPTLNLSVRLFNLTGNYRYELRGKHLGAYFLGGGGLYYRHTHLSREETTGNSIECTPAWIWWGFSCTSGTVTENQTVGSWSATAPGYNGGIGFTFRVGDPPYRFYTESRYHYAPNKRINTQLIDITFGIRY